MTYDKLKATDIMIVNRGDNSYSVSVADVKDSNKLKNDDQFLVNRGANSYRISKLDLEAEIGGGGDEPAIITQPTLTATPDTWPSALTATEATTVNATKDATYAPWFKDGVQIAGSSGLTYTATSSGQYKYQERWVGTNGADIDPPPQSAPVTIAQPEVATPTVIAPANGAGEGGDIKYFPESSAIANPGDVTGGWNAVDVSEIGEEWTSIAYGDGKFVAVGYDGLNMYSADGINWSPGSGAGPNDWYSVTYGNGKFVAAGYYSSDFISSFMYSTDGINWSPGSGPGEWGDSSDWDSVAYGNGTFVAVGEYAPADAGARSSVTYSTDGVNWSVKPRQFDDPDKWYSVTYGNGKFVAVGSEGTSRAMYSTDGINWSPGSGAEANSWDSVTYGNDKFVAVSSNGTNRVMYSANGINWSPATAAAANQWRSVTYGNDKFVAVAQDGNYRVMYSANGIDWSPATAAEANQWYGVAYGGDKFVSVAISGANRVMWSATGTDASATFTFTNDKAYNSDTDEETTTISEAFFAGTKITGKGGNGSQPTGVLTADADNNGPTMNLTDLTGTWETGMTAVGDTELTQAAPDPAALEFVGSVPAASRGTISTWSNATWTVRDHSDNSTQTQDASISPGVQQRLKVSDAADITLAGGTTYDVTVKYEATDCVPKTSAANTFKTAAGGGNPGWFPAEAAEDNSWRSATYGGNKFVAVSNNGTNRVMYSTNGIDWSPALAAEANGWYSVTYGGGKFVAVATSGTNRVMYSTDGINWSPALAAEANGWYSVTYGGDKFVAVSNSGTNQVMYSPTGLDGTWTNVGVTGVEANQWYSVTYGGGKFVAVSNSGTDRVMYSDNGINWNSAPSAEASSWLSVAYGNGKFVAVAYAGTSRVIYSANGIDWSPTPAAEDNDWRSVTYGGDKFVAVGISGTNRVMHSTDGINWQSASAAEDNSWRGVTYGFDKFVAVSNNGTNQVMYSFTGTSVFNTRYYDTNAAKAINGDGIVSKYGIEPDSNAAKQLGFAELTEQPDYSVSGYEPQQDRRYKPLQDLSEDLAVAEATIELQRELMAAAAERMIETIEDEREEDKPEA